MSTKSDSIENGGHMAGPSADTEADAPILPPLEELFGNEAQDLDDLFNSMLDVAVDPNTEMPEGDLIPDLDSFPEEGAEDPSADEASHEVDLADLDDSGSLVDDATTARPVWYATQDVSHVEFGHGWVQGAGNGVVSVRFETAATGPGKTRTFRIDDEDLSPANPLDSLAWDLDGLAED